MSSVDLCDALWRKSSYSNGQANCAETAIIGQDSRLVAVRDSKAPAGPILTFRPSAWRRFTTSVQRGPGEFDVPAGLISEAPGFLGVLSDA